MSDFLAEMALSSRERADAGMRACGLAELRRRVEDLPPPRPPRLDPIGVIAEVKRRSPAVGVLSDGGGAGYVARQARAYEAGGASVISVLTEPSRFDGSLADLAEAAAAVSVPVMRKDFLVDPWQIWEARAEGAGGVLLIAAMLTDEDVARMLDAAAACGVFVLIEAFDEADLDRCGRWAPWGGGTLWVGVNTRDLRSLQVDTARLGRLAPRLPRSVPCVAESGIGGGEDFAAAVRHGYSVALVGSALMRAADPEAAVRALRQAGRAACT